MAPTISFSISFDLHLNFLEYKIFQITTLGFQSDHNETDIMSFLAKLFINGRAINVLHTNIHFYQNIHPSTFQPTSTPMGGLFNVTIETDGNNDLLHLMVSPDAMCKGYIRFYEYDAASKLMDYEFFDTYVVGHTTEFHANTSGPMVNRLVFSPGILRIGDMVFEKHWKITDLAAGTEHDPEKMDDNFDIGPETE